MLSPEGTPGRSMHRVFQTFIDLLTTAENPADFSKALTVTANALDLSCFAYLALPGSRNNRPRLISTYPPEWTSHYLESQYQRIDPVIVEALRCREPFRWGIGFSCGSSSLMQQQLLDEASHYGIRLGFTVPIHDGHGPTAALTFASDEPSHPFELCLKTHERVLQLMAMYFHAHVRRKLECDNKINGIALSPRELECLNWAARGKSAWEIGCILGISRHTVVSYLDAAKEKLGVRTIVQAAVVLAAARRDERK